MIPIVWVGFVLSIILLLVVARKDLALGMFLAALLLGIFTPSTTFIGRIIHLGRTIYSTFTDPSILLLALVVGFIPLIGGALEVSGQMDVMVQNIRIGRKAFLAFSPALLGMLPMPGGALLSAPFVDKASDKKAKNETKVAINVWFRHVLFLIYPLSPALIASAKIAKLEVYTVLLYLFPAFIFSILLGYLFWLRNIRGGMDYKDKFSAKGLIPIGIILIAPLADLFMKKVFKLPVKEIATLIGVSISLILSMAFGRIGIKELAKIGKKMKPWKFAAIILGMFLFLNVFKSSSIPEHLKDFTLPSELLCVVLGFLFGVVTGRIQVPASIVIPVYLVKYGPMSPIVFAITYFSIFLGYVISPIHPCVSVSVEYFKVSIRDFLKVMVIPTFSTLLLLLILSFFFL